ncbi:Ku70/Ku80 beta-barrel domain protein [Candidatus Tiddalikarchaeum anstoanum]|nr:Ku70/Ku80 beta-barrel domain protein [Candidatus Tiddalikarchaeum anstoanum]
MKSVWNGALTFGLVNIPIKLYSAVKSQALGFTILHNSCHTPLHYKRWCEKDNVEVPWTDVVKGLEIKKGEYYVFTKEDFEKIRPEKTNNIEIFEFVDSDQIDPIYFEKHYFVVPDVRKEKAYFLFKEVLQSTNKIAIGRFVMREREYICSVESYKNGLLLNTLNYEYEIADIKSIKELDESPKIEIEELKLAKALIEKLYSKDLEMNKYRDSFTEQLKKMLKKKEEIIIEPLKAKKPGKNLLDALKESLK